MFLAQNSLVDMYQIIGVAGGVVGLQRPGAGGLAHGRAAVWAVQHPQDRVGPRFFIQRVAVQLALAAIFQH